MINRILIVDDQEDIHVLHGRMAERKGFTPECFYNPREAISHLASLNGNPLPVAYFIDMNFPPEDKLFLRPLAEYIMRRDKRSNLYFVTGTYSPPDRSLIASLDFDETRVILKRDALDKIPEILARIKPAARLPSQSLSRQH